MIAVTPAAQEQIRSAAMGMKGWHVRVRVEIFRDGRGTPAGFKNRVDLDPEVYPEIDLIDESQGIPVLVDRRSADFLEGGVLDWVEGKDGRAGFQFEKLAK